MDKRIAPIVLLSLVLLSGACGRGENKGLRAYLLTKADLPTGFTEQPVEEDESQKPMGTEKSCLEGAEDAVPNKEKASTGFTTADGARQISHDVQGYDTGKAEEAMAEGRKVLERCKTFSEPVEGGSMTGSLAAVDFTKFGDDTTAFTLQATIQNITLNGMVVAVRKGDVISSVSSIVGSGQVDRAALEELVRKAVAKLP